MPKTKAPTVFGGSFLFSMMIIALG
jgi:hypothetical protein